MTWMSNRLTTRRATTPEWQAARPSLRDLSRKLTGPSFCRAAAFAVLLWTAAGASAQFSQYTPPGSLGSAPDNAREDLERALEQARWGLGPFRLEPWYALKDVAWVDSALGEAVGGSADLTATAGVGLRAYLPVSENLTLALHALPEYVWWRDQDERRQLNGRFGAGIFGFFANATFELTATRAETQRIVTPEVEALVSARRDRIGSAFDLPLGGAFGVFGAAEQVEHKHLEGEPDGLELPALDALDRDEQILRGGLRYRVGGLEIGAGVEATEVEFAPQALVRSHDGSSPFVRLEYQTELLKLTLEAVSRELEPVAGSDFVPYDDLTGEARLHYFTGSRLRLGLYHLLELGYTLDERYSYFEANRSGISSAVDLGWRSRLSVFGESGANDYVLATVDTEPRTDDVSAFGVRLNVQLSDTLLASFGFTMTDYDSNFDTFDRELTIVRAGLVLGSGRSAWW